MSSIQNDQEFIQSMIRQGKRKRKSEDEHSLSNGKIRRITIKTEPEQVFEHLLSSVQKKTLTLSLAIKQPTTIDSISTF